MCKNKRVRVRYFILFSVFFAIPHGLQSEIPLVKSDHALFEIAVSDNHLSKTEVYQTPVDGLHILGLGHHTQTRLLAQSYRNNYTNGNQVFMINPQTWEQKGTIHTVGQAPTISGISGNNLIILTIGSPHTQLNKKSGILLEFYELETSWMHKLFGVRATRRRLIPLLDTTTPILGNLSPEKTVLTETGLMGVIVSNYKNPSQSRDNTHHKTVFFSTNIIDRTLKGVLTLPHSTFRMSQCFYLSGEWYLSGAPHTEFTQPRRNELVKVSADYATISPILELPSNQLLLNVFTQADTAYWLIHSGDPHTNSTLLQTYNPTTKQWVGTPKKLSNFYPNATQLSPKQLLLYTQTGDLILYNLDSGILDHLPLVIDQLVN